MTDKKTGRAALDGIDIRLGDLFGDLGAALTEMIERLDAGADGEVRRVHEFDTARGPIRAQAGIRIRMGGIEAGRGGRDPSRPTAAGFDTAHPDTDSSLRTDGTAVGIEFVHPAHLAIGADVELLDHFSQRGA